jgi:hypothetical protein
MKLGHHLDDFVEGEHNNDFLKTSLQGQLTTSNLDPPQIHLHTQGHIMHHLCISQETNKITFTWFICI